MKVKDEEILKIKSESKKLFQSLLEIRKKVENEIAEKEQKEEKYEKLKKLVYPLKNELEKTTSELADVRGENKSL